MTDPQTALTVDDNGGRPLFPPGTRIEFTADAGHRATGRVHGAERRTHQPWVYTVAVDGGGHEAGPDGSGTTASAAGFVRLPGS